MIREDAARPPIADRPPPPEPVDTFDAAMHDVVELTTALTSAISKLAYADGARVRAQLERALSRAQPLAEHLPGGSQRAEALRQLGEMHAVVTRMLMIAPAPSSAAIEAAEAGDPTAWNQEQEAWIAGRLARGSSPQLPKHRRARRATRPDSPKALRETPGEARDAGAMTSGPALAPSRAPASDKVGPR